MNLKVSCLLFLFSASSWASPLDNISTITQVDIMNTTKENKSEIHEECKKERILNFIPYHNFKKNKCIKITTTTRHPIGLQASLSSKDSEQIKLIEILLSQDRHQVHRDQINSLSNIIQNGGIDVSLKNLAENFNKEKIQITYFNTVNTKLENNWTATESSVTTTFIRLSSKPTLKVKIFNNSDTTENELIFEINLYQENHHTDGNGGDYIPTTFEPIVDEGLFEDVINTHLNEIIENDKKEKESLKMLKNSLKNFE